MSAESEARLQLFEQLAALPSDRFEALLFALDIPAGIVGGPRAPQGNRVTDLLDWAEGSIRCGLEHLASVLAQVEAGEVGATAINFAPYLQSILTDEDYREGDQVYTTTTVEGRKQEPQAKFSKRLKLRVETVKPEKEQSFDSRSAQGAQEQREQIEQWDVLAGLRNYVAEHVLLIGKPGSGKSTSLERLLWEEAENALQNAETKIPVLVKLRRCTSTIEQLIQDFFLGHELPLAVTDIAALLQQGKLLLLLDGLNELPDSFGTAVANFRDRYRKTIPMVVSTRDLAVGGTLGITKTLKMLPLTEPQMQEFVRGYLGDDGDKLFQQLKGDRLRKFAETPLLLWMLCRVFVQNGQVPANLGLAFREFTQLYDQEIQADAATELREQWPKLLRHLAFALMHDKELVEFRLSMSREEAENLLADCLQQEGRSSARELAERGLQDLLTYHLLQPVKQANLEEHIEFRHQLIQEYYAAEYLLRLLPELSDQQLKRDYLNFLKWTEPIALMLALVDEEDQVLQIVRLAIDDVDSMLGAKLTIGIKLSLQSKASNIIAEKNIPIWLKIFLLSKTQSLRAVDELTRVFEDSEADIRRKVVWSSRHLNGNFAISILNLGLEDPDPGVREVAVRAFGEFNLREAVPHIISAIRQEASAAVKTSAVICVLGQSDSESAVLELLKLMEDSEHEVSSMAEHNLKEMRPELVKTVATKCIEDSSTETPTRISAVRLLGEIGDANSAFPLFQAQLNLNQEIYLEAHKALIKIKKRAKERNSKYVASKKQETQRLQIENWLNHLKSEEAVPRGNAVLYLSSLLNEEEALDLVKKALSDRHHYVRGHAISSLLKLIGEKAIPEAIKALGDPHYHVREQASKALLGFNNLTCSEDLDISAEITSSLTFTLIFSQDEREKKAVANTLVNLLDLTPSQILGEKLRDAFLEISSHCNNLFRRKAAKGLRFFDDTKAGDRLLEMLGDSDSLVAWGAAEELKKMSCEITGIYLPNLQSTICCEPNKEFILDVILSIQSRCKFYNHEIWQESIENAKSEIRNKEQEQAGQTNNIFPNATEVKIFEQVDRYYEHPPDTNPESIK